jgi:hypothetical protein
MMKAGLPGSAATCLPGYIDPPLFAADRPFAIL